MEPVVIYTHCENLNERQCQLSLTGEFQESMCQCLRIVEPFLSWSLFDDVMLEERRCQCLA